MICENAGDSAVNNYPGRYVSTDVMQDGFVD